MIYSNISTQGKVEILYLLEFCFHLNAHRYQCISTKATDTCILILHDLRGLHR